MPEGNVALSPWSLQSVLQMAWAGAAGPNREQMATVLGYQRSGSGEAFAELRRIFSALPEGESRVELLQAEWIFAQKGLSIRPDYLATLGEFGAGMQLVDFRDHAEEARTTINRWVERATRHRIRDFLGPSTVHAATRAILVDALYFKARWQNSFDRGETRSMLFRLDEQRNVSVPMMKKRSEMAWGRRPGLTVVGIPYTDPDLQLLVLLPDSPEGLPKLEETLTPELLAECAAIDFVDTTLFLPRFRLDAPTIALRDALIDLGMTHAFDKPRGSSDFSKMVETASAEEFHLADVLQKVFVVVNEEGTEAAAANAATFSFGGLPPEKPKFIMVNRPFLFAIQHRPSATCLFLGRVTDPR